MTGETGTLGYMAPEPYNRKCDVYSFGICLWETYCCDLPYVNLSFAEVSSSVVRKVEPDAYYIIYTLGERLYEGCEQACILKFNRDTTIYKLPTDATKFVDEKPTDDN